MDNKTKETYYRLAEKDFCIDCLSENLGVYCDPDNKDFIKLQMQCLDCSGLNIYPDRAFYYDHYDVSTLYE